MGSISAHFTYLDTILDQIKIQGVVFVKNALMALIVFLIGKWVIKKLIRLTGAFMEKKGTDLSLRTFLKSLITVTLWLLLVIVIIGILGIETSSFIALFASAGVAIGMAFSGTLQNFAGGVMILLFRPFKVGDFIITAEYSGTVQEIQIFNTILLTFDNQRVIIPNGGLSTGAMTNLSSEPTRRVDRKFRVAPGVSLQEVKTLAAQIFAADKRILQHPEPYVTVDIDTEVCLIVRVWCATADYWDVYRYLNESFYNTLTQNGIDLIYRQVGVVTKDNQTKTESNSLITT